MNIPIKYITDIPEDAYIQILNVVYNEYKNTLSDLNRYADKLATNKIERPLKGSTITKRCRNGKYFIYMPEDDPFDMEYQVMCRIQTIRINEILSTFLKKEDLEIDMYQFIDKNIFLSDLAKEFSHTFNKKTSVEYDFGYIKVIVHIFLGVEDKIITV